MAHSLLLTVITSLLIVCPAEMVTGLVTLDAKDPVFLITQWLESDNYEWKIYGEAEAGLSYNSSTYVIPGDIAAIILECNASYPVEITFEMDETFDTGSLLLVYNLMTKARREANSIADKSSYQYSMKYEIFSPSNQVTGHYFCRSIQHPEIQSRMYLMWEGSSPPYLLGASTTITVSSTKKEFVVLPCKTSVPDIEVYLEKEMNVTKDNNETAMEFMTLSLNESITYDSTYGFSLNVGQMSNVDGRYRCSTDEEDDELYLTVTSDSPKSKPRFAPTTRGSEMATLSYDPRDHSLTCCSNSAKPPTLMYIITTTPTTSKTVRNIVVQNTDAIAKLYYSHSTVSKNCSKQPVQGYSGLAICKGDGIDTLLEVFFPVERTENGTRIDEIYKKWSDAKPENLLHIHVLNISKVVFEDAYGTYSYMAEENWKPDTVMYSGQTVAFRCETSPYYFATGIKWKIEWANKTVEWPEATDIEDMRSYMYYWGHSKPISVVVHKDMTSITCFAPVWNTSDWVEKNLPLHIENPIEPVISSSCAEYITWTLNDTDKLLECTTTAGEPTPHMHWLKDGQELFSDLSEVFINYSDPGTLTLDIKLVSYDTHGVYTCVSSNIAGTAEMSFTVFVEEAHPWVATIVITVISIVLILGVGFLIYKIKSQRNMTATLQRTEFQRSRDLD